MASPFASGTTEDNSKNSTMENHPLPVGAFDSCLKENRKERGEKKKKLRKSSLRPSIYASRQDRYLNEQLLPEVDNAVTEVVTHRKYTAHDIDGLEQEYYRLKLQQHTSAPVDTSELDQISAQVQMAATPSESTLKLVRALKEAEKFMASRKSRSEAADGVQEMQSIKKIFEL